MLKDVIAALAFGALVFGIIGMWAAQVGLPA